MSLVLDQSEIKGKAFVTYMPARDFPRSAATALLRLMIPLGATLLTNVFPAFGMYLLCIVIGSFNFQRWLLKSRVISCIWLSYLVLAGLVWKCSLSPFLFLVWERKWSFNRSTTQCNSCPISSTNCWEKATHDMQTAGRWLRKWKVSFLKKLWWCVCGEVKLNYLDCFIEIFSINTTSDISKL